MTSIKNQLREDKALRDEARGVIDLNIAHVKSLVAPDSLRERTVTPASAKARELRAQTAETAADNKGKIAAIVGAAASAAILWFVRKPLLSLIDEQLSGSPAKNAGQDDAQTIDPDQEAV